MMQEQLRIFTSRLPGEMISRAGELVAWVTLFYDFAHLGRTGTVVGGVLGFAAGEVVPVAVGAVAS
ncbi:hypothetical protein [Nocardia tengchongensis]|uniref:hypothetical protein n=1 Tax=Nocardia tengchongensis TaxID=2055889 RepID=UPI0036CBF071